MTDQTPRTAEDRDHTKHDDWWCECGHPYAAGESATALAQARAEGLDVDAITKALHRWDMRRRPAAARAHSWGYYRDQAGYIVRECRAILSETAR